MKIGSGEAAHLKRKLNEYRSVKRVHAAEIIIAHDGFGTDTQPTITLLLNDGTHGMFGVSLELMTRGGYTPQIGDRLVVYDNDDGSSYVSISPKKAFEDGYRVSNLLHKARPTVSELEQILAQPDAKVETQANGEVRASTGYQALPPQIGVGYEVVPPISLTGDGVALLSTAHPSDLSPEALETAEIDLPKQRNIGYAVQCLMLGQKMRRRDWEEDRFLVEVHGIVFHVHGGADRQVFSWIPDQADVVAMDWEIAE